VPPGVRAVAAYRGIGPLRGDDRLELCAHQFFVSADEFEKPFLGPS